MIFGPRIHLETKMRTKENQYIRNNNNTSKVTSNVKQNYSSMPTYTCRRVKIRNTSRSLETIFSQQPKMRTIQMSMNPDPNIINIWNMPTVYCHSATQRKAPLTHLSTWMTLENMLCTIRQARKDNHYVFVLHEMFRIGKLRKPNRRFEVFRSWGRAGSHCLKDLWFLFVMM